MEEVTYSAVRARLDQTAACHLRLEEVVCRAAARAPRSTGTLL
jgi:hypothetical protein